MFQKPKGIRYIICMGGRAGARSHTSSQYALAKLIAPDYFRCAIMRYVYGDIRNSIFQEIIDRAEEQEIKDILDIKEHTLTIKYGQNSINGIGFKKSSGEQKAKLKSLANYNTIIVEEADEVSEADFQQLDDSLRTVKGDITIILLFNPPHKSHWAIKRWFNLVPSGVEGYYRAELKQSADNAIFINTTYKDNIKNLSETTIDNYERYRENNSDHYYNMIRGLVSEGARGRIFKDWKAITDKEFNELPYPSTYGLDFGFTNDPATCIEIKKHNENVWVREVFYETGLLNKHIAQKLQGITEPIYADSAEPKSIAELNTYGLNVIPSTKGSDSIRAGIDLMLGLNFHYTESSTNIANETQNYKWALDRDKNPTNNPVDEFNHAVDAIRYNLFTQNNSGFIGFV